MHVAFCGPISLWLLKGLLADAADVPKGYECPLMAYVVRALVEAGMRVTVVTSCCDVDRTRKWFGNNIQVIATPRRRHYVCCLDAYRKEIRLMRQAILEEGPDIVHANWMYEFADAALRTKLPYLVTSHDSPWSVVKASRHWYRLYRAIYASARVIPRIQNVSFVSPYLERECLKYHRLTGRRYVVPNGIASELVASSPMQRVRDPECPQFICASSWGALKNTKTLLHAFAQARARLPRASLTVVGPGFQAGGPAHDWAEKAALAQGVVFGGSVSHEQVLALLSQSDVFVHTTLEESFCMAVLEAMAVGLPCIGGVDSGAVPWLLDDGRAGVVVDVRSPKAVADAMIQVVEDPALYCRIAAQGHARVKERFTLDAVAKQYVSVYEEILRDTSSHRLS